MQLRCCCLVKRPQLGFDSKAGSALTPRSSTRLARLKKKSWIGCQSPWLAIAMAACHCNGNHNCGWLVVDAEAQGYHQA